MPREFALPDLGEGIAEAQVIRLLVKEGDKVAEDQGLMEVETDKAAVEIPSPYAGVITKVHVAEGETVNVGKIVVTFDGGGSDKPAAAPASSPAASKANGAAAAPAKPATPALAAAKATASAEPPEGVKRTVVPAAPAVRKMAREMGIDLDSVTPSGPGGRVTREDVENHKSQAASAPAPNAAGGKAAASAPAARSIQLTPSAPPPGAAGSDKYGPTRTDKISQIRKTISAQMKRSAYTVPHVTHNDDVDITSLEKLRKEVNDLTGGNPRLTAMTFVVRACCIALRNHPVFNSSFDEENGVVIYKEYYNIGIAVDTPRGLIVPVIKNADRLSLTGIGYELSRIAENVRNNNFAIEDIRGGTFTLTNVGALGGLVSTPIINYPEIAILGLGKARKMAKFDDKNNVYPAMMLPVNLSFDHRAADGAAAARFVGEIINYLEHPALFLLH